MYPAPMAFVIIAAARLPALLLHYQCAISLLVVYPVQQPRGESEVRGASHRNSETPRLLRPPSPRFYALDYL